MADTPPADRPLRILVRSDSQGTSVETGEVAVDDPRLWASVLGRLLEERGVDAVVRNASVPGMRVGDALRTRAADPLVRSAEDWADVITVTLGINDVWPMGRPPFVGRVMDRTRPVLLRRAMRKGYRIVEPKLIMATKQRLHATSFAETRRLLSELVRQYRADGHGVVLLTPYQVRSPSTPGFDGNSDAACDLVLDVGRAEGVPAVDTRDLIPPLQYTRISEDHDHTDAAGHHAIAVAMADAMKAAGLLRPSVGRGAPPDTAGRILLRGRPGGPLANDAVVEALGAEESDVVPALVDGYSLDDELRCVRHDPLVREPVVAADLTVVAPGEPRKPTAWDREQLGELLDALPQGRVVLVDDHGPWSTALREVAATRDVRVASGTPAAIAATVHDVVAVRAAADAVAPDRPSRSELVARNLRRAIDAGDFGGDERPIRFLVRGDSQATYVGKRRVKPHDERLWASVLVDELAERGVPAEVWNGSPPGLMIGEALAGYRGDTLVREAVEWADVVVFAISINDFWPVARPQAVADWMDRARPLVLRRAVNSAYRRMRPRLLVWTRGRIRPTPPERARADYDTLVRELLAAGKQAALVTPLPVRSPINPLLDGNTEEAAEAVCAVARGAGIPVVDCRELFPAASWEKISADHLHANEDGHRLVARTLVDQLEAFAVLRRHDAAADRPDGEGRVLLRGHRDGPLADPAVAAALGDDARLALAADYSVHFDVRWIPLDPLVHDAYAAASVAVVAPGGRKPPSAWDREQLGSLVDLITPIVPLVLVDDGGAWSAAIRAVATAKDVAVAGAAPTSVAQAVDTARSSTVTASGLPSEQDAGDEPQREETEHQAEDAGAEHDVLQELGAEPVERPSEERDET